MNQTYSVRINRKDLYKGNYNQKEYKDKDESKDIVINKNLVDLFEKMLEQGA